MDGNGLPNFTRVAITTPPVSIAAASKAGLALELRLRTLRLDVGRTFRLQHLDIVFPRWIATGMGSGRILAGLRLFLAENPGGNGETGYE